MRHACRQAGAGGLNEKLWPIVVSCVWCLFSVVVSS